MASWTPWMLPAHGHPRELRTRPPVRTDLANASLPSDDLTAAFSPTGGSIPGDEGVAWSQGGRQTRAAVSPPPLLFFLKKSYNDKNRTGALVSPQKPGSRQR